jgi:sec-independent protein translocase protein TatA
VVDAFQLGHRANGVIALRTDAWLAIRFSPARADRAGAEKPPAHLSEHRDDEVANSLTMGCRTMPPVEGAAMLANLFGADSAIVLIVVVVVLLFGGSRLPKLARGLGSASHEFRKGLEEGEREEAARQESKSREAAPNVVRDTERDAD